MQEGIEQKAIATVEAVQKHADRQTNEALANIPVERIEQLKELARQAQMSAMLQKRLPQFSGTRFDTSKTFQSNGYRDSRGPFDLTGNFLTNVANSVIVALRTPMSVADAGLNYVKDVAVRSNPARNMHAIVRIPSYAISIPVGVIRGALKAPRLLTAGIVRGIGEAVLPLAGLTQYKSYREQTDGFRRRMEGNNIFTKIF